VITHRLRTFAAILALGAVAATAPVAAELRPTPKIRKAQAVSKWAFERIERAHELLEQEKYGEVIAVLDDMKGNRRLNDHERSLMWQAYGYAYSSQDDYTKAAEAFEQSLKANGLPPQSALNTRYNLAQLYVMLERYKEAIALFEEWFALAENPSPGAYYMLALAYLQNGEKDKALPPAEQAVAKAERPKEAWLGLLLSIRFERKEYDQAAGVLERLVELYPKKLYWKQLAAVYSETGDSEKALATLEVAYIQGLLTEEGELINLAELYLYNQLPYKAAKVLEHGFEQGLLGEKARSWELLADSWLHARERERALEPLRHAAELADTGDVYVRLAQLHLEREEWAQAIAALAKGLAKGNLKNPGLAQLFYGIANASMRRWEDAERALRAAQRDEKYEKVATQWLTNLERERSLAETTRQPEEKS
jgi:tetratricopeptide (TPR) repeat protein